MSADFTPEKEDYKILTPFKMQVLTNFPYIEADFDALTNYGLLCKVVEYLNNVIHNENEVTEQVTSLYNAYVSLQAYVNQEIGDFETTVNNRVDGLETYMNNYFNNLDVQQEINNKLDAMAADGTLTNLIKAYVDPIYEAYETEINNEIDTFKSSINSQIDLIDDKVNSATSGSPKGVYSTVSALESADPDHDYIYVVTATGNWYFYDTSTSTWTSGGTYQSSGIDDDSIEYVKLKKEIVNNASDSFITENHIQKINKGLNSTDYTQNNQEWAMTFFQEYKLISFLPKFSVTTGTYDWELYESTNEVSANEPITLIASGTCNVGTPIILNRIVNNHNVLYIKNASSGFAYNEERNYYSRLCLINRTSLITTNVYSYRACGTFVIETTNEKLFNNIDYDRYITPSKNILNLHADDLEENCYYHNNTKVVANDHNESGYIYCLPCTMYVIPTTATYVQCYDKDKNYITEINSNLSKQIITPTTCYYIRVALPKGDSYNSYMVVESDTYPDTYIPYGITIKNSNIDNILQYKTCVQLGDSITWYDGHTQGETIVKGYASYLRDNGMIVNNAGVSGACIADNPNHSYVDVCFTVDNIDFSNYEYVTIAGGINDYQIGNIPRGDFATSSFDKTTFIGAYQYIINKILTDNKDIKILLMTPLLSSDNNYSTTPNGANLTLKDYRDMIIEIAKYYALPVLDYFYESGFNRDTLTAFTIDGLHPRNRGYARIANELVTKMKSI